jgi:hypothetical protein
MRAKQKKSSRAKNEGAQISSELESDRAIMMNLESFGVDGAVYDETETEPKFDKLK